MAQILVVAMRSETSPVMGLLKNSGHEIVFAPGFEPAIRRLDQIAPDLLITDVRLGGFNGLHLVIRSQSSRPNMRSILLDRVHDPVVAMDAVGRGGVRRGVREGGTLRVPPSPGRRSGFAGRRPAVSAPEAGQSARRSSPQASDYERFFATKSQLTR